MRRSDLKHAQEICELLWSLTQGDGNAVYIFADSITVCRDYVEFRYQGPSLVECLRAAKADEPQKEK